MTTDRLRASPGQRAALVALIDHGGVKQAARALGIGDRALAHRLVLLRERNGLTTHQLAYLLGVEEREGPA